MSKLIPSVSDQVIRDVVPVDLSDAVVRVGFGVGDNEGRELMKKLEIALREMDAVSENRVFRNEAEAAQPLYRAVVAGPEGRCRDRHVLRRSEYEWESFRDAEASFSIASTPSVRVRLA